MRILLIAILFTPLFTYGQTNEGYDYPLDYDNPPWKLPCESEYTQAQMNICSAKKCSVADSIMNDLLSKNLEYYDEILQMERRPLQKHGDSTYYKQFALTISQLSKTQEQFINYRNSLIQLENSKWTGGSIRPLMINIAYLNATIDRVKWLELLLEDNMSK